MGPGQSSSASADGPGAVVCIIPIAIDLVSRCLPFMGLTPNRRGDLSKKYILQNLCDPSFQIN